MRLKEFTTPLKTPDQLRIDSLKATKEKAAKAVTSERQRQQVAKAQQSLTVAKHSTQPRPPSF